MSEVWRLTDKEIRAVEFRGNNMAEAQRAKRQAFIDNGGIILNPDALEDMHEALKAIMGERFTREEPSPKTVLMAENALSKAEGK